MLSETLAKLSPWRWMFCYPAEDSVFLQECGRLWWCPAHIWAPGADTKAAAPHWLQQHEISAGSAVQHHSCTPSQQFCCLPAHLFCTAAPTSFLPLTPTNMKTLENNLPILHTALLPLFSLSSFLSIILITPCLPALLFSSASPS